MIIVSIILSIILMFILKFLIFDYEASYITEVIVYTLFNTVIMMLFNINSISFLSVLGVFIMFLLIGLVVVLILRIISERLDGLAFIIIGIIMDLAVKFGAAIFIAVIATIILSSSSQSLINY